MFACKYMYLIFFFKIMRIRYRLLGRERSAAMKGYGCLNYISGDISPLLKAENGCVVAVVVVVI